MRPFIQRIAAASLFLRSSRSLWPAVPLVRPTLAHYLPSYFQPQQASFIEGGARFFSHSTPTHHQTTEEVSDQFQFIAYAAWHPKSRQKIANNNKKVPYWKESKVGKVDAGEDAFFKTNTPEGLALGVADGVGGWSLVGVDPALFSWTLMDNAAVAAKNGNDAHQILDIAFHELRKSGKVAAGSSTACILNLSKTTGKMTTCNLGDSAFILIRDQKIVYESPSQQHYFNCPYQLTVVPESYPNRDELVTDLPKDADTKSFFLKDGDLIVLATDGYFDNVYAEETLELIQEGMKPIWENQEDDDELVTATIRNLAKTLTDRARRLSLNPMRMSPWAKEARAHGNYYKGGKIDDITCIVTLVRNKKQ